MSKYIVGAKYLEGSDINEDGSLKPSVHGGKPVILMLQGNFCGYCTQAKPAFSGLVDLLRGKVVVATIQTDGDEGDKAAAAHISKVYTSPGVPQFLGFKGGRFVRAHQGERSTESLKNFALSL